MQNNNLIGRITQPIELKYTKDSKAVCDLNVAINNGKDDTTFLRLTVFGKQAENCSKYLEKGSMIGANYMIKNHNWENEKGKHYDYTFLITRIVFLQSASKTSIKEEKPDSEAKNMVKNDDKKTISDDIFKEFGNTIEIDESDIAF